MSNEGNAAPGAASAAANHAEPAPPVLAPTGNASLDVLVGDLNDVFAPFQNLSDPDATGLDKASDIVNGILGAVMAPVTLLNDGFALATAGIAKLFPPLPAATLGMFHLGIPHLHTHPPAMPVPLPSFGPVALAGCVSVLINGIPAARAGDLGISVTCGSLAPPFEVFTGSSKVFIGGARAARMLDITKHCQPGAAAGKAMSTLEKVVSRGGIALGVAGIGAEALTAVDKAVDAEEGKKKKVEPEKRHIEPEVVKYEDIAVDFDDPADAAAAFADAQAAAIEAAAAAQRAADQQAADEAALEQLMIDDKAEADSETAKFTGIQAGLDAAAMALSFLMGMDPGMPPCFGAVLTGMPNVLIGGFPMPPWFAVARGLGKLGKGLKKGLTRSKASFKCDREGHPIDPVTGANVGECIDYQATGPAPFQWGRSYSSADAGSHGPMGRGFRHSFDHRLTVDLDQATYTDAEGQAVEIPLPGPSQPEICRAGYTLRVQADKARTTYVVEQAGKPTLEFVRARGAETEPRLTRCRLPGAPWMDLQRDALGRLTGMVEHGLPSPTETRLVLDEVGHIVEVRRGPQGARELPRIAAYGYDSAGCLITWQDALGARESYSYDAAHRLVKLVYRSGYSFHYTYDAQGRCVEEHGEDGLWRVALRYEPEQRRTVVTRANGGEWIYTCAENGTIVSIQDPHGDILERVVDDEGRVVREIGPGGRSLQLLNDARTGGHFGVVDGFGYLHPPLDELDSLPGPPEDPLLDTAWDQQWGHALAAWPALDTWTAPASQTPELRRDALGRIVESVDASGHRASWDYSAEGDVVRYVDRDGREHRSALVSWNLVGAELDPLGHRTSYEYTAHAEVARIVDPGGSESRYDYDLKDRLARVVRHGAVYDEYAYDRNGSLIEKRDGAGNVLLRRSNTVDGLPTERRLASGEVYRFDYDGRGRLTRTAVNGLEVRNEHDWRGRRVADERDGQGVRHHFGDQELRETIYFGRFTVTYRQDRSSLVIEAPVGGQHRVRQLEPTSVLTELGSGTSVHSSYDGEGRCLGRVVQRRRSDKLARWSVRYHYSAEGDLRRVDDDARGTTEYTYDPAHRLTGEAGPDGKRTSILLDPAGNVLEKPGLSRAELDEGNRLRAAGGERFRYDTRAHLAEQQSPSGETTRYRYDSLGMLVEVAWSGRAETWTAAYDGLGRRMHKELGGKRTTYFWDGDRIAAESGPTGAVRLYVYPGPEALVPLLFLDYDSVDADPASGRVYYVIGNQIGVPLHIEDQAGNVVWRADEVEPYGGLTVQAGATIRYDLRFPGHCFDEETGLHDNRFRSYSPRLGRYLQCDPSGQSGGINLYAYAANPLVDVDVLGLFPCKKLRERLGLRRRETAPPPPRQKRNQGPDSWSYDAHEMQDRNFDPPQALPNYPGIAIMYNPTTRPHFQAVVESNLAIIAGTPTGQALLNSIAQSTPGNAHPNAPGINVIIRPTFEHVMIPNGMMRSGGTVVPARTLGPRPFNQTPMSGSMATSLDTDQARLTNSIPGTGSVGTLMFNDTVRVTSLGEEVPSVIVLAHEMIHLEHYLRGAGRDGKDGEWGVVGIKGYENEAITENKIRQELGMPVRTGYYPDD
jgi:RHS repeat-associated protein